MDEDKQNPMSFLSEMPAPDQLRHAGLHGRVDNIDVLLNALASLSEGISVFDGDKRLLAWNDRYQELFSYPDSLLVPGTPLENFIRYNAERGEYGPGDTDEITQRELKTAAIRTHSGYLRFRTDGRVIAVAGRPMRHGGFLTLFSDETERYRAEEALRMSELRMRRQTAALHRISLSEPVIRGDLKPAIREIGRILAETLGLARLAIWLAEENTPDLMVCREQVEYGMSFSPPDAVLWRHDSNGYLDALEREGLLSTLDQTSEIPPRLPCFVTASSSNQDCADSGKETHSKIGLDAAIRVGSEMRGLIALERDTDASAAPPPGYTAQSISDWHLDERTFLEAAAQFISMLLIARDRKRAEQFAEQLSSTDSLTGLGNRNRFLENLERALARSQRDGHQGAVLLVDLDNFKDINDMLGHEAGDQLLCLAARRIQSCVRATDLVARPGGDEFAVVCGQVAHAEDAATLGERIQMALASPVEIDGTAVETSGTIGISVFPDDGTDSGQMQQNVEMAMYQAKEAGRGSLRFFSAEMGRKIRQRSDVRRELKAALENDQFRLYYQPKTLMQTGEIIGAEALLRWHHPEHGLIPPDEFIPVAEQSGLIIPLGAWVIREACRQTREWLSAGNNRFQIAINLSTVQFRRGDLVESILQTMQDYNLNPSQVQFEITESVLLHDDSQVSESMRNLEALGVEIALDDFGTGYSSLSYLKRFNVDVVKIDKSFISDLERDRDDASITQAVIALARSLNIRVVAEGVETPSQESFLRALGCDYGQGYLYARPLPAEDFTALLEKQADTVMVRQ